MGRGYPPARMDRHLVGNHLRMSQPKLLTEVVPGIEHWSAPHPAHGQVVHSHYLTRQRVAIDPIGTDGLLDALRAAGGVEQVVLSNRHHLRGAEDIARELGAAIRVPRAGLHEFDGPDGPEVIAYEWND